MVESIETTKALFQFYKHEKRQNLDTPDPDPGPRPQNSPAAVGFFCLWAGGRVCCAGQERRTGGERQKRQSGELDETRRAPCKGGKTSCAREGLRKVLAGAADMTIAAAQTCASGRSYNWPPRPNYARTARSLPKGLLKLAAPPAERRPRRQVYTHIGAALLRGRPRSGPAAAAGRAQADSCRRTRADDCENIKVNTGWRKTSFNLKRLRRGTP